MNGLNANGEWQYRKATHESGIFMAEQYKGMPLKGFAFWKPGVDVEIFIGQGEFPINPEYDTPDPVNGYNKHTTLECFINEMGGNYGTYNVRGTWGACSNKHWGPKNTFFGLFDISGDKKVYGEDYFAGPELKSYGSGSYPYGGPYCSQSELEQIFELRDNFPNLPVPDYVAKDMHEILVDAVKELVLGISIKVIRTPAFKEAVPVNVSKIKVSAN